jgi:beta-lactamase regulating signal transducer with metallopeptidase domain
MNDFILATWELFLSSLTPLICLALGVSVAGWLLVGCRVSLRLRIVASSITFSLLVLGSALIMVAPFVTVPAAKVPVMTEVFEAARDASEEVVWQSSLPKVVNRSQVGAGAEPVSFAARDLVGIAWVLGTVVSLIRLVRDAWKLRQHLRWLLRSGAGDLASSLPSSCRLEGMHHSVILADPGASSPYSCGWWRRVVVLPESWLNEEPETLRLALDHEHAHLRHRDAVTQLVWRLGKALWWWNPFIHALAGRVDELLEWRADAEATRGEADRAFQLSRKLVEIVSSSATPRLAHAMAASTATLLRRRLMQMLGDDSQSLVSRWTHRCLALLLGTAALGVLAGCSLPLLGARHAEPFPGGETLHTTPDHWAEVKDKLPVQKAPKETSTTRGGFGDGGFEEKVARMEQSMSRVGKPSKTQIAIEVRIIETVRPVPTPAIPPPIVVTASMVSADDLSSWLRDASADPGTKIVSYPRMVTYNGHPVMIRSVVNQPVGSPNSDEIVYLPIGNVILLGAIQRPDGRLHLEADITLSKIIGSERVKGSDYPIVSSLVYQAAYEEGSGIDVPPGSSVMIPMTQSEGKQITIVVTPSVVSADARNLKATDFIPDGK